MESAINLEFLASKNDDKYFDQFVKFSLGPERELYDIIEANVAARGGEVWPIEQRMFGLNQQCLPGIRCDNHGSKPKIRGLGRRP
jgi:hypothetical protein